jgi:sulfhydrogenase subunit alpha
MKDIAINVRHVTRVEGHGNILVNTKNGSIEQCEWQVPESPRFFEAMVRGRHYSEVARITSRICGICSIGHTLASVKATEHALGIQVTPQTKKLRTLLKHAENYDSHILHSLILVAPDLLGVPSVFPLVETHPEIVSLALQLKRFGHEWGALIGGRTTHPTKVIPGGLSAFPTDDELIKLREQMVTEIAPKLDSVLDLVASLAPKFPQFERETEYMALHDDDEYALYDGVIQTIMPDGSISKYDIADYRSCTNEYVSPLSTAKYARNQMDSYMAGALARFNNNYEQLHPEAKKVAELLGMKPLCFNTYLNTAAQVIEIVHNVYDSIRLIDELVQEGVKEEQLILPEVYDREGVGAAEVPRGILYHSYIYDKEGICQKGNCIIPTNQNHGNLQKDMEALVPKLLDENKSEEEMTLALEMLVRAYDPCISCSTHFLKVRFI